MSRGDDRWIRRRGRKCREEKLRWLAVMRVMYFVVRILFFFSL
jgi:hypothetical protein